MRILLTGATGFIGSAFVRLACSQGHEIAGMALPAETVPSALQNLPNCRWLRGTLETVPWNEVQAFKPEICVHAAWITTPGVYLESPENERFRDASYEFVKQSVKRGVRRVIALGTCIEYKITPEPLNELTTSLEPTTTYARCKNELRLALETEAAREGLGFCWARVFYPYGPGEHPARLCSAIIQKLSRGEEITLKTPDSRKDYIYIDDLASALLCVTTAPANGAVNLGTGKSISVREIANTLGALLGRAHLVKSAARTEVDPFPNVVADNAKLRSFGWSQRTELEQGLSQLLEARGARGNA